MITEINLEVFMEEENKQQRILAVQRFKSGERPESICTSLGKSKAWLYKWINRHIENNDSWSKSRSRRPLTVSTYHLVRLIRSDLKLNIFGEIFPVPPELKLEYVVATINVKEQKLKLFLDKTQVEEFKYKLR